MTTALAQRLAALTQVSAAQLDIVVPVYTEETDLEPNVRRLYACLTTRLPFTFRLTTNPKAHVGRRGRRRWRRSGVR